MLNAAARQSRPVRRRVSRWRGCAASAEVVVEVAWRAARRARASATLGVGGARLGAGVGIESLGGLRGERELVRLPTARNGDVREVRAALVLLLVRGCVDASSGEGGESCLLGASCA